MSRCLVALSLCLCVFLIPNLSIAAQPNLGAVGPTDQSRAVVAERLISLGLTEQQAQERLAQLTDAEVMQLAAQPDLLQSAGHVDTTTVMVVVLVVVGIVAIISIAS